jgi:hypothetical protein
MELLRNPLAAEVPERDYWLTHCEGYRVDSSDGRIGFVEEVRGGDGPSCAGSNRVR